jgi:hypothetical protein
MRMNAKSPIIAGDGFRDSFPCLLEVLVTRIDVKPLTRYVVRRQLGNSSRIGGLLKGLASAQETARRSLARRSKRYPV